MPKQKVNQGNPATLPSSSSGRRKIAWWKKGSFAILLVGVFFGLLEVVLALFGVQPVLYDADPLAGFDSNIPLFTKARGADGTVQMATARNKLAFFNQQQFPADKSSGTYRIFCVGGSTTFGRPYGASTSFAGWLGEFLPIADPSRRWEVINAGGISYASYRVSSLMEELIQYEPDLFVVYSGQNEFLERRTYSTVLETPESVRGLQGLLSHTRTWAILSEILKKDSAKPSDDPDLLPEEVETLLGDSVGLEAYARDDPFATQVLQHYRVNLVRMVDIARSVGAQVVMVTPASNLGTCSPFKDQQSDGLSRDEVAEFISYHSAAEAKFEDEEYEEAIRLVEQALKIDSRVASLHYLHGRLLRRLGRSDQAKLAFLRAIDEDVCPLRALTPMAKIATEVANEKEVPLVDFVALVEGRTKDGIPDHDQFLDHVHPSIELHRELALSILDKLTAEGVVKPQSSWGPETIQALVQEVEGQLDHAAHARALRNLSKVLAWAGKTEEAERLSLRSIQLAPEAGSAPMFHQTGVVKAQSGDFEEAEKNFRRALDLDAELVEAHHSLAVLLTRTERAAEAVPYFERVLKADPGDVKTLNALGVALQQLKKLDDARRHYERALEEDPWNHKVLNNLGILLFEKKEFAEAKECYERSVDIEPRFADAHFNLGRLALVLRRAPDAQKHFREAIAIRPNHLEALCALGELYETEGRVDASVENYDTVLSFDPRHAKAHYNRGRLAEKQKDTVEAEKHYKSAIESDPDYARAHNNLGRLYAQQGNIAEAASHFRRAVELDPNDSAARRNLGQAEEILGSGN